MLLLCNTAVTIIPVNIPRKGLVPKRIKIFLIVSSSASGLTAELIIASPRNNNPKLRSASPLFLFLSFFAERKTTVPANTNRGAIVVNLKAINCAVTVVPTLAPIMIARAAARGINPAFKNPIMMTNVALELCITAVTKAPINVALSLPEVTFSSIVFSSPWDNFFKESLRRYIPNMNSPRPPIIPEIIVKFISSPDEEVTSYELRL